MKISDLEILFRRMTLEEKIGQLAQGTGKHFAPDMGAELVETGPRADVDGLKQEELYRMGSVLGVSSAAAVNQVQRTYLKQNRLGIPLLFMHDAIHGYRTIFPIPLALSCSFDRELVRKAGAFTAAELRASGIHVDFSPMTDLVRDPRWGRVMESFGEDHILAGDLGKAMIEGYQQSEDGFIGENGVAACLKHFAAYGAPEGGRDYASADMSLKEFFGYYTIPYETALEARPKMVMSSFQSLNGEPVTGSSFLLKEVLREKFGFQGLLISDWGAVSELKNHGVAENDKAAAYTALNAGVDVEMVSTTFFRYGKEIISCDPDLARQVDSAVWKMLLLKNELGLFENPYVEEDKESGKILTEETLSFAKEAAVKSCVLLKNEHILPAASNVDSIILLGEWADSRELLGNWQCKGKFEEAVSLMDGLKRLAPEARIEAYRTVEECGRKKLMTCDLVLVTIGESWELSGEGHSSADIELSKSQQDMIRQISSVRKDFACIAFSGRPLALGNVIREIPGLLWCWYPGTMGGAAAAELILGYAAPSGRLTMSFPRTSGQIPVRYNEYRSGRPANESSYSSRYQDQEIGALFPFGFGLTYGKVRYGEAVISAQVITEESPVTLTVSVTNESDFLIDETVILYMEDPISANVRPLREMLQYKKAALKSREQKMVSFIIEAADLKYLNHKLEKTLEPGSIRFYVNETVSPVAEVVYLQDAGGGSVQRCADGSCE